MSTELNLVDSFQPQKHISDISARTLSFKLEKPPTKFANIAKIAQKVRKIRDSSDYTWMKIAPKHIRRLSLR